MFTSKTPRSNRPSKRQSIIPPTTPTNPNALAPRTVTALPPQQSPLYVGRPTTSAVTPISKTPKPSSKVDDAELPRTPSQQPYQQIFGPTPTKSRDKNIIQQTDRHIVELYSNFPRELRDILVASNLDHTNCAATIDDLNYCSFIVSSLQTLFCWRVQSLAASTESPTCLQLELPPSNLGYSTKLLSTSGFSKGSSDPAISAFFATKEGHLRYWPNISNKKSYDANITLDPKVQLTHLTLCEHSSYVLGTSNGSLYHIILSSNHQMQIRPLQEGGASAAASSSMFYGLGSLLWGKSSSNSAVGGAVQAIIPGKTDQSGREVFVLAQGIFQKWSISRNEKEKLVVEYNLHEAVHNLMTREEEEQKTSMKVWLLDMKANSDRTKLYVLVASMSHYNEATTRVEGNSPVTYSIVELKHVQEQTLPVIGKAFSIQYQPAYEAKEEKFLLERVRLELTPAGASAFVYWPNMIVMTKVPVDERPLDSLPLQRVNDSVIGSGATDVRALFVTLRHGIVSVTQFGLSDKLFEADSHMEVSFETPEVTLESLEKAEERRDLLSRAFKSYFHGKKNDAKSLCSPLHKLAHSLIDETILSISSMILNALPKRDISWSEVGTVTSSLLLRHQLDEKRQKHKMFVEFLKETGLIEKLSSHAAGELFRHSEKLGAAINLRNLMQTVSKDYILMRAIEKFLRVRDSHRRAPDMSSQDLFYSEVSHIEEILQHIFDLLNGPNASVQEVDQANQIFETILASFSPLSINSPIVKSQIFVRDVAESQITLSFDQIQNLKQLGVDPNVTQRLFYQLHVLTDFVLAAYQDEVRVAIETETNGSGINMEELPRLQVFETRRAALIGLFIEQGQEDIALKLAEKYKDFSAIVRICEEDSAKLEYYMNLFSEDNFVEFLFKMYLDTKKYRKLLNPPEAYYDRLSAFLRNHSRLSWLHDIHTKSTDNAAFTLHALALEEKRLLGRRKTILSLSKLACLASNGRDQNHMQALKNRNDALLYLIKAQAELGDSQPASPEEVIRGFLNKRGTSELDILIALEIWRSLTEFIQQPNEVFIDIWMETFKLSRWSTLAAEWEKSYINDTIAESAIRETIFFKVACNERVSDLVTRDLLLEVCGRYEQQYGTANNATLHRLLETVVNLIEQEKMQEN